MRNYLIVIEKNKTGYSTYVPDLPGCIATGKSKGLVQNNIASAIEFHLEGLKHSKQRIPSQNAEAMNILFGHQRTLAPEGGANCLQNTFA